MTVECIKQQIDRKSQRRNFTTTRVYSGMNQRFRRKIIEVAGYSQIVTHCKGQSKNHRAAV